MILTIRPARQEDAEFISRNLRADDAREVETASGLPAEVVVPLSLAHSREAYVIHLQSREGGIEKDPCALFGVSDDKRMEGLGVMWLVGTSAMRRGALSIIREAPHWLDHFNRLYPNGLHNIVDSRNDLHVRWLQLTGFVFGDVQPILQDVPFLHAMRFTEKTEECVTP